MPASSELPLELGEEVERIERGKAFGIEGAQATGDTLLGRREQVELVRCARRQRRFDHLRLLALDLPQHVLGANAHRLGHAREARHVDA